jgi:hypothetical protein
MNLKHSGKLSSLDVLDMRDLRQRITLHRNITSLDIEEIPCAMIPYQESSRYAASVRREIKFNFFFFFFFFFFWVTV